MSAKQKKERKRKHKSANPGKYEEIHELSYYLNDRLKLMKEIVKIMKPHKIKSMAPEYFKNSKFDDIMVMLMDELLGISNKRLKYIFSGKRDDVASSSCTDSEEESSKALETTRKDEVISLTDGNSDDDITLCSRKEMKPSIEDENAKISKTSTKTKECRENKEQSDNAKLMSVLELLELQARARAIRSQLALETEVEEKKCKIMDFKPEDSDSEAVVIESPKKEEVIISSSDSELDDKVKNQKTHKEQSSGTLSLQNYIRTSEERPESSVLLQNSAICGNRKTKKIKIIRERITNVMSSCSSAEQSDVAKKNEKPIPHNDDSQCKPLTILTETSEHFRKNDVFYKCKKSVNGNVEKTNNCSDNEPDVIIINLDESDDLQCDDV